MNDELLNAHDVAKLLGLKDVANVYSYYNKNSHRYDERFPLPCKCAKRAQDYHPNYLWHKESLQIYCEDRKRRKTVKNASITRNNKDFKKLVGELKQCVSSGLIWDNVVEVLEFDDAVYLTIKCER